MNYCADQSLNAMDLSPEVRKYYQASETIVDLGTIAYGGVKSAVSGIRNFNLVQQEAKLLVTPQRTATETLANINLAILEKSTEEIAKARAFAFNTLPISKNNDYINLASKERAIHAPIPIIY